MKVEIFSNHSFLPDRIRPDGVVFDFGVNCGGFARLIAGRCHRVIGFEADPMWHDGRLSLPDNVTLVPKALAAHTGKLRFFVNREKCSSLHYAEPGAVAVEVEALTLAQALAMAPQGRIELIKLDIEGEEVPIMLEAPADLFRRVAQITVEFHDFMDPASVPKIRDVITRMRGLGFHDIRFSWNSYGDMLFVNEQMDPLTWWQKAYVRLRHKYLRGIGRLARRLLRLQGSVS